MEAIEHELAMMDHELAAPLTNTWKGYLNQAKRHTEMAMGTGCLSTTDTCLPLVGFCFGVCVVSGDRVLKGDELWHVLIHSRGTLR
eukprot:3882279-Amphidinium_carterae.2